MSIHCENQAKAKITLTLLNGVKENILSSKCPINIETQKIFSDTLIAYSGNGVGTPCFKHLFWINPDPPAVWIWSSYYAKPSSTVDERASFTVNFNLNNSENLQLDVAVDNYADIIFNNTTIGRANSYGSIQGFLITGNSGTNTLTFDCVNEKGSEEPEKNPGGLYFKLNIRKSNCRILINDSETVLYNKVFNECPTYEVACNDECPEGYCKCASTNYPGYCCIPSNKIKAQLIASKIAVRNLKNG